MSHKYFPLITMVLMLVVIDQLTKFYIDSNFILYQSLEVISGYFNITYIRNSGVAFGILSGFKGIVSQIIFIFISLIAISAIIIIYRGTDDKMIFSRISLSLILSGAIGNMIDRIFRGEVIDFFDFHWKSYHWPAFNIADSCITIGVGLLMITMIISNEQRAMSNE
ncbi:MAG: signal peptidase II [Nitrospinae bacterium RIFCSPLOWO2_02_FULL_39_110]|nr:MAG: signal peptidase II [Nitrospinae bacterium RIFCSPHIGHO2_02_39_11]OGV99791.1 MAG: signal peptidase II [Nitrospinae bacterium RIFCSPHIGHO2_12_FULL_39_42]OGW01610.1 MAG: signal peptidase II [Nitrospinae bacterium RIFCSPHIGHO2_02_FULL_39_82]OGW02199.1 MAG: signal peptidase II [Nitrospinae bacterium RIFCSPLOWO2_02_39_17]OGW06031.1 MAG: signal peptidase II [Nitrospinae bacterium RIFCSPLOWO2_02_FULL_39_110]OGW11281.1 MAG: signal peptidase II [Nitrospinae bacterium RIFCSPLOWO2_12_FULL_39_93]O